MVNLLVALRPPRPWASAPSTLAQVSTPAEQFTVPCTAHGEGPFWDAANDRLLLVDMLAGAVVTVDAAGVT